MDSPVSIMALFRNNVVLFKHFYVGNKLKSIKVFLNDPYAPEIGHTRKPTLGEQ